MTSFATSRHTTARKTYRCACCRHTIPPGTRHLKMVGRWQGDFYSERMHDDCYALWGAVFNDWGDPSDGMPYDLVDVFCDSGDDAAVRAEMDARRGFFPHAFWRGRRGLGTAPRSHLQDGGPTQTQHGFLNRIQEA